MENITLEKSNKIAALLCLILLVVVFTCFLFYSKEVPIGLSIVSDNLLSEKQTYRNLEIITDAGSGDIPKKSLEKPITGRYIVKFKEEALVQTEARLIQEKAKSNNIFFTNNYIKGEVSRRARQVDLAHQRAKNDIISLLSEQKEKQKEVGIAASEIQQNLDFKEYKTIFNGMALSVSEDIANEIRGLSYVEEVYEDKEMHIVLMDSIPLINADDIWNLKDTSQRNITGKDITIAIIDTGIDYTHADLGGCFGSTCKVMDGWDFVNNDADPMDDHGHGTHVAGTAAGSGLGGLKGVAPDAKLVSYKTCDNSGSCSMSNVISAIEKATDPNQDGYTADHYSIISMSLGAPGDPNDAISQAADNSVKAGVVVVAAAGNDGPEEQTIGSPGNARKVITVGASNNDYGRNSSLSANGLFIDSIGLLRSGLVNNLIADLKNVSGYGNSSDFSQSGDFTGKIALVSRGSISFGEKVKNAYNAGAIGVIVYNSGPGNFLGALTNSSNVPAISVSQENGTYLLNLLQSGNVKITMTIIKDINYPNYLASFSSRGPTKINTIKPDIVAPGTFICASRFDSYQPGYECLDNSHIAISGTSMATPHVAGVIALIKQAHPDWTPDEIKNSIKNTAVDLGLNYTDQGWGRVDALTAVNLSSAPCIAELNSSDWQGLVSRSIDISGIVTCRDNFKNWTLEYGKSYDPNNWTLIKSSANQVNGILANWNTTSLNSGIYTIKLTVNNYNVPSSSDVLFTGIGMNTTMPITNCVELQAMKDNLLGNYYLTKNIDCSDTLNWNSGKGFEPVGNSRIMFSGKFDGRNNNISKLYINSSDSSVSDVGLFGVINSNSEIRNVNLIEFNIIGAGNTGSLVGQNYGSVFSSSSSGKIKGSDDFLGGLIGWNNGGTVSDSYSKVNVEGYKDVGGLVGLNGGKILNSYSIGNISASKGITYDKGLYVGGIAGSNSGVILNSSFSGTISGDSFVSGISTNGGIISDSWSDAHIIGKDFVGGIAGNNYETISNSYFTGYVSGNTFVGGLIGSNDGSIFNSYSTGIVNGTNFSVNVGGLAGQNGYWATISNSYSTGDVFGFEQVGGIAGSNYYYAKIFNSYSKSSINGVNSIGGLVGTHEWYSEIINSYSTGKVVGSSAVGGLVGRVSYYPICNSSFWDINNSNKLTSACGTGKTTDQMKIGSTFTDYGWDFNDVWSISSNVNYNYPYLLYPKPKAITTCYELQNMKYNLAGSYYLVNDIDCSDTINWISAERQRQGFEPIATGFNTAIGSFTGTFDGEGHKIINLYIGDNGRSMKGAGLFARTLYADIKNVGLENVLINTSYALTSGALVANSEYGTIISSSYSTGLNNNIMGKFSAGLVGKNAGTIMNSYSSVNVINGVSYVGGLVGLNYWIITNSYSTGNITGITGSTHVGGLVGWSSTSGNITNSYSTGNVDATTYIGGLIGLNHGICTSSFWDINISNKSTSSCGIGRTTSQMKTKSTYAGWDFDNIWSINETISYPWLRLQIGEDWGDDGAGCSVNLINTTKTSWINLTCSEGKMNQSRSWIQYDSNNCGTTANKTFYEYNLAGPLLQNSSWTLWRNISCLSNDKMNQSRNLTQFDVYACSSNTIFYEYQTTEVCIYCTPNLMNTTMSGWMNISCLLNNVMNQSRSKTQYDINNCGTIVNKTFYEYQTNGTCVYCPPNFANTNWTEWINITDCSDNTQNQSRNLTQYDRNNCPDRTNTTIFEYRSENCSLPSTTQPSSGGNGGTTAIAEIYSPQSTELASGYNEKLSNGDSIKFEVTGTTAKHSLTVKALTTKSATLTIQSDPFEVNISVGEEKEINLDNDSYYDLSIKLNNITSNKANLTIKTIHKLIVGKTSSTTTTQAGEENMSSSTVESETPQTAKDYTKIIIISVIVLILIILIILAGIFIIKIISRKNRLKEESRIDEINSLLNEGNQAVSSGAMNKAKRLYADIKDKYSLLNKCPEKDIIYKNIINFYNKLEL